MGVLRTAVAGGVAALLLAAAPALAAWSAPATLRTAANVEDAAFAVDGHGDVAYAWAASKRPAFNGPESIHLTVALAGGRVIARTLVAGATIRERSIAVAIGAGEATVAWGYFGRGRSESVAAAWGPLAGRWAAAKRIGGESEPSDFLPPGFAPALAPAPDGSVLLAWDAPGGVRVAWRAPHRAFAPSQPVAGAAQGADPRFDAAGNAYLVSSCAGTVAVARAHTRTFHSRTLASGSVAGMVLSLSGPGTGLAAWVEGECSYGGAAVNYGPVFASVLRAGSFSAPIALTKPGEEAYPGNATASAAGGGEVTWFETNTGAAPTFEGGLTGYGTQIGPGGAVGTPSLVTSDQPAALDGGGDALFLPGGLLAGATTPFVRPAAAGPDDPAPASARSVVETAVAPFGRAAAVVIAPSGTAPPGAVQVSVWRPSA